MGSGWRSAFANALDMERRRVVAGKGRGAGGKRARHGIMDASCYGVAASSFFLSKPIYKPPGQPQLKGTMACWHDRLKKSFCRLPAPKLSVRTQKVTASQGTGQWQGSSSIRGPEHHLTRRMRGADASRDLLCLAGDAGMIQDKFTCANLVHTRPHWPLNPF